MDNKALKHSWDYNLCLLIFLMVTCASPFMMFSLKTFFDILINRDFLLKWLLIYKFAIALSIIIFSTFIRVNSRSLKYSVLTMSTLLIIQPIVILYSYRNYLKCSLYLLGILCGFVQGLIYMGLIPFMKNSKFTGKYTWPAHIFADIPLTSFFILTINSLTNRTFDYISIIWYVYSVMAIITFGIFLIILRIEKYEKCLVVSPSERKIMEEIVLERRLSNCSTNIADTHYTRRDDNIFDRVKYSIGTIAIWWKLALLITISTITFSLPIPFIIDNPLTQPIIIRYFLYSGVFRVLCLTIPFFSRNFSLGNTSATIISFFSCIYITIPSLITLITRHHGIFMELLLSLSSLVQSLVICGLLSNLPNLLQDNKSDNRKNSLLAMVVLITFIGHALGIISGQITNRLTAA